MKKSKCNKGDEHQMATQCGTADQDFVIDEAALERMKYVKVLPEHLKSPFVIYESATLEQKRKMDETIRQKWRKKK